MKQSEVEALLTILVAAFPRVEIKKATFDVYVNDLIDLDRAEAVAAVADLRCTSQWFPSIAEIRSAVAERRLAAPESMAAYAEARDLKLAGKRHPLVEQAKRLCGDTWWWSNEPTYVLRKAFLAAYEEVIAEAMREIVQRPALEAKLQPELESEVQTSAETAKV